MSNDDPTRRMDEELPATPPAQPTIETVLQRILELGTRLEQKIEQSEERLRQELNKNFRALERRLDVMSVDINKLRADMRDLETRIDQFEERPA